jgi:signal transduction histidine kinase/CheY-like chemotaxis protein
MGMKTPEEPPERAAAAKIGGPTRSVFEGVFATEQQSSFVQDSMLPHKRARIIILVLLAGFIAHAQEVVTLEQAGSRTRPDFAAAYEGRTITVRAQVAAQPVWAFGTYYLALRDSSEHGLILRGDQDRFASYEPGDWIEATGKIESRAGLPLLVPDSMERVRQGPPPGPKSMLLPEAANLRHVGLLVETSGTVTRVGENSGGTILQLADRGATAGAFLARSPGVTNDLLTRIHVGDRVTATGLVTQYAPKAPFDGDFQIMLASPVDLKVSGTGPGLTPLIALVSLTGIAMILAVWWIRSRRIKDQHISMRAFHTLCEEIIAAPSPSEIAEKLMTVLPAITQATAAWLYIYNRRTKSLERVATEADPEPMVVPIESQADENLANGAAVCFQNRTHLNIPDLRRSRYVHTRTKQSPPRSAMMLPLTTQGAVLGVLEAGNANRLGYFTIEEQASIQHLANQVATALKLQEQRTMREQLFRSEKLAATGQLISGVANELRAPLEVILHLSLHLATALAAHHEEVVPERDLRLLAGESQRASEIVSRLVSFARPEDSETRNFDINALLVGLAQFREPEWKALGLRLQKSIAPEPAFVLGAQGQLEQVFLNLLVHAEQSAADVPSKTVTVATSVIAGRVTVEIGYSAQGDETRGNEAVDADPFIESRSSGSVALSLSVCRSIVHSHGGGMRFSTRAGLAYFEVDLPVVRTEIRTEGSRAGRPERALTIMLVDPDPGPQRQLLGLLSVRGHRVVPAAPEEAADLAKRLRFDAVLWAMRLAGPTGGAKWSDFQEKARASIATFVLVSDGYDAELARSIEEGGNFLLGRPIQESELDYVLRQIDARAPSAARR